eukprot:m.352146 g.352146  ORF g.352146 m.352146 type:complete len:319 (+) comp55910_c0_seq1:303-1259(+)
MAYNCSGSIPVQSQAETNALLAVGTVSGSFSILGSLLIFLSYFLWKDIRSPPRRLLVYLAFCDLLTAMFNIIGLGLKYDPANSRSTSCVIQSFFTTWSSMASFCWTLSIGVYLYFALVYRQLALANKLIMWFHVIAWGLPLILTIAALADEKLGYDPNFSRGWCWIVCLDQRQETLWHTLEGKGLEIITIICTVVIYARIKYFLSFQKANPEHLHLITVEGKQAISDIDSKLLFVPAVFIFLRIWGTTKFLLTAFGDYQPYYWLQVLQNFGDSAQGWTNALLFCVWTKKVRQHFVSALGLSRKSRPASINSSASPLRA